MLPANFLLGWAVPESAAHYDPAALPFADRERAGRVRGVRAEQDWRVSRALLASLPPDWQAGSLSHSRGHALCVASALPMRLGVDLERVVPRDVQALGRWVCSEAEQRTLAHLDPDSRLDYFYLLWTLKEAFVKAAGLDFPADMPSVGLDGSPGGTLRLRPAAGAWGAVAFRLAPDWMAALVWEGDQTVPRLAWHAGPASAVPVGKCVGLWHGTAPVNP